ncbi:MAG: NUDIX domain-containing protein [Flavobacteriaceae bacterium]
MLGGMSELPGSDWAAGAAAGPPPLAGEWRALPGTVRHVFTHFALELTVHRAELDAAAPAGHWWQPLGDIAAAGLPTVMLKALSHGLGRPLKR